MSKLTELEIRRKRPRVSRSATRLCEKAWTFTFRGSRRNNRSARSKIIASLASSAEYHGHVSRSTFALCFFPGREKTLARVCTGVERSGVMEDEEEEEEERKRKKEPGRRRRRRPGYVSAFFPRWHGYSKNWVEYPWRSFLKPAFRFDPGHSAGKRSSSTN